MKHQAQANDFYCGPATASMIVNFKGKTTTQNTFAGASYLQTDKLGASPFWTERMAPSLNSVLGISRYRTVHKPSLATLKGAFVNSVNARYPLAVGTVELKGTAYNGHPSGTVIGTLDRRTWLRQQRHEPLIRRPCHQCLAQHHQGHLRSVGEQLPRLRRPQRQRTRVLMRQRRRPLLWALLAVVTLTAACEANASPGGAATAPTSISEPDNDQATAKTGPSTHMAWPDGAGIEPTAITVPAPADARPAHVEIERTLDYDMTTGPIPTVRAISLEGVALVDSMDAAAFDTDTWTLTATTPVNLWTDSGLEPVGDTTALVPGDPHRQVISGAFVSETVTWKETASTDMFQSDWRMFRRDIDDGEVEVLARSEQVHPEGRLPRAVGGPMLAPFGDRVAWHTTYAREDGTLRTKLVSVPATGGELRDEADLVAMPEGVDDGWVVLRMIDQTVAGAEEGWEIQDANTVASVST